MHLKQISLILLFLTNMVCVWSQPVFEDRTSFYIPDLEFRSGNCGGFTDINGDYLDDLLVIDKADQMFVGYNQGAGLPLNWVSGPKVSSNREYLSLVADLNNDDKKEIITSGVFSRTKVYSQNEQGVFSFQQQIKRSLLAQGGNVADMNGDGFIDLMVCSDEDENLIALNDGNGELQEDTLLFMWTTDPHSDNSGNYSSEWADFNGDGKIDVHIAKCRAGVNDPADPRRINRLMIQQNDGTFVDEAEQRGLAIGWQSWTGAVADFDNDGDFDVFVTNHDFPHQLMLNDGNGYFSESSFIDEPFLDYTFQSIVRDFDNDGYEDILITGQGKTTLLMGDESGSFTPVNGILPDAANHAIAGDINQDGKIDIMAFFSTGINTPGSTPDRLYVNSTSNGNQYLDILLKGRISNRDGVGAEIRLYTNLGIMSRIVKGGESYGITNSLTQHFGLGQQPRVDSLVIDWPSGVQDIYFPDVFNRLIIYEESSCQNPNVSIADPTIFLCDSIITSLEAPEGFANYLWSNGDTSRIIEILEPGLYSVSFLDGEGCIFRSNPVVAVSGNIVGQLLDVKNTQVCYGDSIVLSGPLAAKGLLWSSGEVGSEIVVSESGWQGLEVLDQCDQYHSDSVFLQFIDPEITVCAHDTVTKGANAELFAGGDSILWYLSEDSDFILSSGNYFNVVNVQSSIPFYAEQWLVKYTKTDVGGLDSLYLNEEDDNPDLNLEALIQAYDELLISSFAVYTSIPGSRVFQLLSLDGDLIQEKAVNLSTGYNVIEVDFEIKEAGLYKLTTDSAANLANFGSAGPHLGTYQGSNVSFPYKIGNVCDLRQTLGYPELYPYFANIQIESSKRVCVSDRKELWAYLDIDVSTVDQNEAELRIYPNPASDFLQIENSSTQYFNQFIIYNAQGVLMQSGILTVGDNSINAQDLAPGIYFLRAYLNGNSNEQRSCLKRFVKIR